MRLGVRLSLVVALAAGLAGCDSAKELKQLRRQVDSLNQTVAKIGKDVTDVGVISELGWLSKLLRDSAAGSPAEQEAARATVARLFGVRPDAQSPFFEVTIQFGGLPPTMPTPLVMDLKMSPTDRPPELAALFANAPGNAWQPQAVASPATVMRNEARIRELVAERVGALLPKPSCRNSGSHGSRTGTCTIDATPFEAVSYHEFIPKERALQQLTERRQAFVDALAKIVLTPLEIQGLPPSGALGGQVTRPWGLTAGATRYAVVLVPRTEVEKYPDLTIRGWLHVQGQPGTIVGAGHQIEAVDFVERCLGRVRNNPTPPLDSRAKIGPLCWYAFDLFGNGLAAEVAQLAREAQGRAPGAR